MPRLIIAILLIVLLIGVLPPSPYSQSWGYYPSGGLGLLCIIIGILISLEAPLVGRLMLGFIVPPKTGQVV